jgi:amino acid permease
MSKIEVHPDANLMAKEGYSKESPYEYHSSPIADNTWEVPLEEFLHYALIQRTRDEALVKGAGSEGFEGAYPNPYGKHSNRNAPLAEVTSVESEDATFTEDQLERINARRALRQAGWAAVFFLITTDILGPFNAPIAIAQMGYFVGIVLYIVFGFFALYCGLILWRLYIHLDSDRYPVKTYADLGERIFGRSFRLMCTVLQSLQLIVNVGVICLGNGASLSQIVAGSNGTGYICFSLAVVIWAILGMLVGQIRSLQGLSHLANFSVWLNLLLMFTSMGFMAHGFPNYTGAAQANNNPYSTAAVTTGFWPMPGQPPSVLSGGMMQMVFAYGGAMIFPEIMAEMRRPMDFWKGMACAQGLIFAAYLLYGIVVYTIQGQYTMPLAYLGVTKYAFQTFGNILALITGIIAAVLYGNIGIKVAYVNIVEDWFRGPPLMSKRGHLIWSIMVIVYWGLAFVVGSAVPQLEYVSSFIAAVCIMQFSYTFPPILRFGYDVLVDAMAEDAVFVPGQGTSGRVDTWADNSRWKRGLFTGRVWFKLFNFILFWVFLGVAIFGAWGSTTQIINAFHTYGAPTSFGCVAPV